MGLEAREERGEGSSRRGDTPEPFTFTPTSFELPPEGRQAIATTFSPRAEGVFEAELSFITNEYSLRRIRLQGEAVRARISCDPLELDLGYVLAGESGSGVFSCTNLLDIPIELTLGEFAGELSEKFSAEILGEGDGKSVEIPAGESIYIEVEVDLFVHDRQESAAVTLPLRDASGQVRGRVLTPCI